MPLLLTYFSIFRRPVVWAYNQTNIIKSDKFNFILYHISNAGLINLLEKETNTLQKRISDPLLIKHHRQMEEKYGIMISTYVGLDKNYYILDVDLAKAILEDSPKLLSAGYLKESFFKKFESIFIPGPILEHKVADLIKSPLAPLGLFFLIPS